MLKFLERSDWSTSPRSKDDGASGNILYLGSAKLDLRRREILDSEGKVVSLRPQSMEVLVALARAPGQLMTKDHLAHIAWSGMGVSDENLAQCVADIRRAIGDSAHLIVRTEPRKGYRLVPAASPETVVENGGPKSFLPRRILASAALLSSVILLSWGIVSATGLGANIALVTAEVTEGPSIIVLPFESLDGDPRWQRIGRGIASDIAVELARNKWISVFAPETALAASSGRFDLGSTLGVDFVITGNLQSVDDTLKVSAQLSGKPGGKIIWSRQWTGPSSKIFEIRDEIQAETGAQLGSLYSGILSLEAFKAARSRTKDLDAYDLVLLGLTEKHKFTPEGYERAVAYFESALEIEPQYVEALVHLAMVLAFQSEIAPSPEEGLRLRNESFEAARRAYELDPDNPDAIMRMGVESFLGGDLDKSYEWARRSVEAAPNNADILAAAAWLYYFEGNSDHDTYAWAKRAIELNPAHPEWYNVPLGLTAFFAEDVQTSVEVLRNAPETLETIMVLGAAEALAGDVERARSLSGKFRDNGAISTISDYFGGIDIRNDPRFLPLLRGAELAGFPI